MLSQFPVVAPPETGFQRVWKPIESILRTGADVFSQVAPQVTGRQTYPITPTGQYTAPTIMTTIQKPPALNMNLPLLALGGILLFTMMGKPRRR